MCVMSDSGYHWEEGVWDVSNIHIYFLGKSLMDMLFENPIRHILIICDLTIYSNKVIKITYNHVFTYMYLRTCMCV